MKVRKAGDRWLLAAMRHTGELGVSARDQRAVRRLTKMAELGLVEEVSRTDQFIVYRLREAGWRQQVHPQARP